MSIFTEEITRGLHQVATFLQEDVKQILIDNGHVATHALVESINTTVNSMPSLFTIEQDMLIYGAAIVKGRPKGTRRIPVDVLVKYLNDKNFSRGVKETRGVAFHIQKRIFEEGIEPDDFIEEALNRADTKMEKGIGDTIERALDLSISNLINNAKNIK